VANNIWKSTEADCSLRRAVQVLHAGALVRWLLCFAAVLSLRAAAVEVPLATELKVSGPAVTIRAPLGLRYRPGYALPLQVQVYNPGPAFTGALYVVEGDDGPRCGFLEGLNFPERTARAVTLPVRAPAVTATLALILREGGAATAGPLRFQASLARVLKPLAPDAQVIISCGGALPLSFGPQQEVVPLDARDLPAEDWMYEPLDLIVLGDGSCREAPPAAQQALRRWVASGGRLLAASSDALAFAAAGGFLPLDTAAAGTIGADRAWWEQHAGLTPRNILFEKQNRPLYVHFPLGLGHVVLLFPATSAEDAREFGARAVNHPVLRRARTPVADLRIQPDRFAAFTGGVATTAARQQAGRWTLLGALALCVSLALAYTSRQRLTAAGWPVVVLALLAVLLAKWFPARELGVSRVQLVRQTSDGAVTVTEEWACVEAHTAPQTVALRGAVTPVYADADELRATPLQVALDGPAPVLQTAVYPNQAALFRACSVVTTPGATGRSPVLLHVQGTTLRVVAPHAATAAVWASAKGSLSVLANIGGSGAVDVQPFSDWASVLRAQGMDGSLLQARAAALSWASREALRSGRDTLIFWRELPGEQTGLIELESPAPNAGSLFQISAVQVEVESADEHR
jgi:hypothetical protein